MTFDGDINMPGLSRDVTVAVEYHYVPGSGPIWQRGEPAPISPPDDPEVDIRRVLMAPAEREMVKDANGRPLRHRYEIAGDYQDVTPLMYALLTAREWSEIAGEIASRHADEALEGEAA
jgi:hypothetical protein